MKIITLEPRQRSLSEGSSGVSLTEKFPRRRVYHGFCLYKPVAKVTGIVFKTREIFRQTCEGFAARSSPYRLSEVA